MSVKMRTLLTSREDAYKFTEHHGESCARLSRHESVYVDNDPPGRQLLFQFISTLLCQQPIMYLRELQRVYVDNQLTTVAWMKLANKMKRDWENSVIPVRQCS